MNIRKVIENSERNSQIMLKGPTGSGKSTVLMERYQYMVEKLGIPSEKILVLLLNSSQASEWRSKIMPEGSGAMRVTSYYGFIQEEIRTFYPIMADRCHEIVSKGIKPVFLTYEAAQFLVLKAIEKRREEKDFFSAVAAVNDRIAANITDNLLKAAVSGIPYSEIGNRLYSALAMKDQTKVQIFKELDLILGAYRKRCLELGILDFAMAVELYNDYLLKDDTYRAQLFRRLEHIIVDNVEECVPSEVDFIGFMSSNMRTCLLAYNYEGGFGEAFGGNHQYMLEKLGTSFDMVTMGKSRTCDEHMCEFSEMLFEGIENSKIRHLTNRPKIDRVPAFELRSEMLENAAEKICRLIDEEGYRPSDIAVISTYADTVTELVIGGILENEGYSLRNLARRNKVMDNPYSKALITLAQLCHCGYYRTNPCIDDIRGLVRLLFSMDPVRGSVLAGIVCSQKPHAQFPPMELPELEELVVGHNVGKYRYVRKWIDDYKSRPVPLNMAEFLQKAFLEIVIDDGMSESNIYMVKSFMDSSKKFIDIISRFKNLNADKGFLDMAKGGMKAAESIFALEDRMQGEHVIMSTPAAYLASALKNKVILLMSLSSSNWTPRIAKELTNRHVLTKTWVHGSVYTEEMEEEKQKHYLGILMRSILKRCGDRLITYESQLSANGYENEGILAEYFDQLLR